jgi:hypothetical protein
MAATVSFCMLVIGYITVTAMDSPTASTTIIWSFVTLTGVLAGYGATASIEDLTKLKGMGK